MIELADVRQGNWFIKNSRHDNSQAPSFKFEAVTLDTFFYMSIDGCFPIPLTAGILAKSGFKHDFGDWYMNIAEEGIDGDLPFLRYMLKENSWYLRNVRIPAQPVYLHQLQNLYYTLTKKELTVQLGVYENRNGAEPINFHNKTLGVRTNKVSLL